MTDGLESTPVKLPPRDRRARSMKIYDRVRWNDQRKGLSNYYDCMIKLIMLERIKIVITQAQPNTKPLKKVECE